MKENVAPPSAPAPAPVKAVPSKPERQAAAVVIPTPVPEISAVSSNAPETSSVQESEGDDCPLVKISPFINFCRVDHDYDGRPSA